MWKKRIIICSIIALVLLIGVFTYFAKANNKIKSILERDVIYEGIFINDIDVGGLSREEAMRVLIGWRDDLRRKEFKVFMEEEEAYVLRYGNFLMVVDFNPIVEKAYEVGKEGALKERYGKVKSLQKEPLYFDIQMKPDELILAEFLKQAGQKYKTLPKDAKLFRKDNEFVIEDDVVGKEIDIEKSAKAIETALFMKEGQVKLEVLYIPPKIKKEFYEDVKDTLGSYYTSFSKNQWGRNENLRIASGKINGTILHPGEVFSTNKVIGPTNRKNGYQEAPIILDGKTIPGIGGGVCQISTTLYNAVLFSELKVVERQNHSLPVGYIEKGRDATLAGDYIDFKFQNDTDTPIYIESFIKDYQLHMVIYGKDEREKDRKIKFETAIVETISPPPQKIIFDPNLPVGQEVVEKKPSIGYTVKLYKLIYIKDKLAERKDISTSRYRAVAAQVRRGSLSNEGATIE